jgi:hypothetical protein
LFFIKKVSDFRELKRIFHKYFWWSVLAACSLLLIIYALSAFTKQPTVETITTPAPVFNANNNQMREVDYQAPRKVRKRER